MRMRTLCRTLASLMVATLAACGSTDLGSGSTLSQSIRISEVMYHPVDENAPEDNHEFVELYNRSGAEVDISGWKLGGDIQYQFPDGTRLAPYAYQVIAKKRSALAAVTSYGLSEDKLLGDYVGELDNGGGTVLLQDASGATLDSLTYDDDFPWPMGADALGADDDWLSRLPTPLTRAPYQYRGRSLERVSYDVGSDEISNWIPSPLEGPSPGRGNSLNGAPPTIVQSKVLRWSGSDVLIRASDTVKVTIGFSQLGTFRSPQLEYFVDDVQKAGEPTTVVPLELNNGSYEVSLPPQPSNSIVRYRILADLGSGPVVVSPRPSDPLAWWAYFVTPPISTQAPLYQVFIKKDDWNQLYDNTNYATDDRRVTPGGSATNRCTPRPSWDAMVPVVFVYNGIVYDTFARYQGSRWNRLNGVGFDPSKTTISPLPDRPSNRVLSWKINFPDYAPLENKRQKIVLNKMNQACPGLDDTLGQRLYGDPSIGIPVQQIRYARLHINGGYYHYMMDIEHIDGDMIKRYLAPGERMGDLFKSDGNAGPNDIEGPWGTGDARPLAANPSCPMWTVDDRYEYTYQRLTNKWENNVALRSLIEQMWTLRSQAIATGDYSALRTFIQANFDFQKLMDYIAIRNWAETWDDVFHNYFLYRRVTDGKWVVIPQDKDLEFGEFHGWATGKSFFIGEEGNIDNRLGWHTWKDAFIKAFRPELVARVQELSSTGVLNAASYRSKVDEAAATFSLADYSASPAAASVCNFTTELNNLRNFGPCRSKDLSDGIDPGRCPVASCGLKGDYYQSSTTDMTRSFSTATLRMTRTDTMINFNFGTGSPGGTVPADGFQVRWTGTIVPKYSETYTFYAQTDDGVRLWINGTPLIDKWVVQGATEWSGNITLTAGQAANIVMEYFDSTGSAGARLLWSSPTQCKEVIPLSRLRPM